MRGARGRAYAIDGGLWYSIYGTSVQNSSLEAGSKTARRDQHRVQDRCPFQEHPGSNGNPCVCVVGPVGPANRVPTDVGPEAPINRDDGCGVVMGVGCRGGVGEVVRWWYDDDDDAMVCCGGVMVGRQRRCGWSGEVMERVRESGYGDRIDRKMGSVFGVGRKNPAGKVFRRRSSDGGGGRRWWPAAGGYERERVGELTWNLAQAHTANIISGLEEVRYINEPIIDLYKCSSTSSPSAHHLERLRMSFSWVCLLS
ncbi:hypothetical protein Tco_0413487 [Tanacetum coccineum]